MFRGEATYNDYFVSSVVFVMLLFALLAVLLVANKSTNIVDTYVSNLFFVNSFALIFAVVRDKF